MKKVEVVDYDPAWPAVFDRLRDQVWPVVQDVAISIEHIGSTSVPGAGVEVDYRFEYRDTVRRRSTPDY